MKLVRVLMLGPVVLALSLLTRRLRDETDEAAPHVTAGDRPKRGRPALHQLVPWFIVAFLLVAALRSLGMIPAAMLAPTTAAANLLTTISMAALGLGVDVRVVARAGLRVSAAVTLSLVLLGSNQPCADPRPGRDLGDGECQTTLHCWRHCGRRTRRGNPARGRRRGTKSAERMACPHQRHGMPDTQATATSSARSPTLSWLRRRRGCRPRGPPWRSPTAKGATASGWRSRACASSRSTPRRSPRPRRDASRPRAASSWSSNWRTSRRGPCRRTASS